jgi:hypothetical protein
MGGYVVRGRFSRFSPFSSMVLRTVLLRFTSGEKKKCSSPPHVKKKPSSLESLKKEKLQQGFENFTRLLEIPLRVTTVSYFS